MEGVGLPRYLKGKITLNSKRKPVYREQINNAKCTCKSFKKTDPIKKKKKRDIFPDLSKAFQSNFGSEFRPENARERRRNSAIIFSSCRYLRTQKDK